jgi:hypothetical protein
VGFLSDLATLTREANAAYDRIDVGASLAAAQQSMEQAGRVTAASVVANDPVSLVPGRPETVRLEWGA